MALAGKRSGKSYRVYIVMGDGEAHDPDITELYLSTIDS